VTEQSKTQELQTAREELVFRIRHRDSWLKLNLLAQATLWALAKGIQISGTSSTNPIPEALTLAIPVSFVLAGLYHVEDRLIHYLSKYIGRSWPQSWDASTELREYARGISLPIRVVAQVACFGFLPGYLTYLQFGVDWIRGLVHVLLLMGIVSMIVIGFIQRRTTGSQEA